MSNPPSQQAIKTTKPKLVVATRLHLGNAAAPPDPSKTQQVIGAFAKFVMSSCHSLHYDTTAVIAVDATPKFDNYNYVEAVQAAVPPSVHVLPVTPWGKFVLALNALVGFALQQNADWLLLVSAETQATAVSVNTLCDRLQQDPSVLVAGALLGGHDYQGNNHNNDNESETIVELNGRTTPWNTLAVWNLSKLALTGFQLVSEGYLSPDEPAYGVEEVVAIAILQKLLKPENAKALLVKVPDVQWDVQWEDEERKKWHETKMKSKLERAQRQLTLLGGLAGQVHHC